MNGGGLHPTSGPFIGALVFFGSSAGAVSIARAEEPAAPVAEAPDLNPSLLSLPPEIEERLQRTEDLVLARQPNMVWSGYIDFGFYVPQGDGSGYVQDFGHLHQPAYAGRYGWVFLGDILAPAVNSRGEAADLGSAPGVDRYDSINSRGAPGFAVNEVNFAMRGKISSTASATVSFNVTPRTGNDFRLGDLVDLDIAQVEWLPTESQRTSIFVGKVESVLGIEYRDRKANKRFGITPSLIARYTTGPALGLKVRSKFGADDWLVVAAALTNGSNTVEQFHFYDELDSNAAKTASGRLSVHLPLPFDVEIGGSGSFGGQDRATSNNGAMWFAGPDLIAHVGSVDVKAQWLTGRSPGLPLEDVYGLRLHGGGYLELDWMITPTVGVIGRGEYRDARVWLGDERLYLTKSWRATAGARLVVSDRTIIKAEFLHNGEYGSGMPQVRNDVITSSVVFAY